MDVTDTEKWQRRGGSREGLLWAGQGEPVSGRVIGRNECPC